jgi:hypothetical protein
MFNQEIISAETITLMEIITLRQSYNPSIKNSNLIVIDSHPNLQNHLLSSKATSIMLRDHCLIEENPCQYYRCLIGVIKS